MLPNTTHDVTVSLVVVVRVAIREVHIPRVRSIRSVRGARPRVRCQR